MNSEQKEAFKEALQKKKVRTEKHITDLKELTQPIAPENAIGRVSRMDAINNLSSTKNFKFRPLTNSEFRSELMRE